MFCRDRDFAKFSLKKSKCRVRNCLGAPFIAYEFAWGRILYKYAVISPDKLNNARKISRRFVFDSYFRFAYDLKTINSSKWPLNIINVSHSYLFMSSQIKQCCCFLAVAWSFVFSSRPQRPMTSDFKVLILTLFRKRRSPYFPTKIRTWSQRLNYYCNCFSNLHVFDITSTMNISLIYNI